MKRKALRTDDHCFQQLPDYPFKPHYCLVQHGDYEPLRLHYVDEGAIDKQPVLMLHGCPAWSFLYRKVIHALRRSPLASSLRLLAPDHIGCGKSDKLLERADYSYQFYVDTIAEFIQQLDLQSIVLVCQDWGGPIGLRVLAQMPERFAAVVATNTLLPNAHNPPDGVAPWPGETISQWIQMTSQADDLPIGQIIQGVTVSELDETITAAYDAPFPDARYKQGVLNWPSLIPTQADSPGIEENRQAWQLLETHNIPLLTAFSDSDPTTSDWQTVFQQRARGAQGVSHVTITQAGHMVQEDQAEQLAAAIEQFITGLAS